ncbi:MAG: RNA methyltransferase [Planctomycetes bacterium]|nr:RNA methyltransferase [Planctomycetota bacterium]
MARLVELSSPKNPLVARVKEAAAGDRPDEMVVEGARVVGEAIAADCEILVGVLAERFASSEAGAALRKGLEARAHQLAIAQDAVFERLSSLTTPQGVLALVRTPRCEERALCGADPARALIVVAAGVRDPGNLGAMLRATEAAGGTGFIAQKGSADPFREKAVRGSSGSVLRLPTLRGLDAPALRAFATRHGLCLAIADAHAPTEYLDADLRGPVMIALGSEGQGVPGELVDVADLRLRIPIQPSVESLNVAVATGVLLFEARRQRR